MNIEELRKAIQIKMISRGPNYMRGFKDCLDLLFPCVEALKSYADYYFYDHAPANDAAKALDKLMESLK